MSISFDNLSVKVGGKKIGPADFAWAYVFLSF